MCGKVDQWTCHIVRQIPCFYDEIMPMLLLPCAQFTPNLGQIDAGERYHSLKQMHEYNPEICICEEDEET